MKINFRDFHAVEPNFFLSDQETKQTGGERVVSSHILSLTPQKLVFLSKESLKVQARLMHMDSIFDQHSPKVISLLGQYHVKDHGVHDYSSIYNIYRNC